MEITDNVSVMRRGEMVTSVKTAETTPAQLAELMVGRKVLLRVDKAPAQPGAPVLEVRGLRMVDAEASSGCAASIWTSAPAKSSASRASPAMARRSFWKFWAAFRRPAQNRRARRLKGEVLALKGSDARARRRAGIGHVPEDRQVEGLIMDFTAWENAAFGYHDAPEFQNDR